MSETAKIYAEGCGWWCRRRKDLSDFLDTPVGSIANSMSGGILGAVSSGLDLIGGRFMDVILTATEQVVMDRWHEQNYLPFLKNISERAGKYVTKTTFTSSDLLEINQLLKEICLVNNYYLIHKEVGVREIVFESRSEYISNTTNAIINVLNEYISIIGVPLNEVSSNFNFTPLAPVVNTIKTGTYPCFTYVEASAIVDEPIDNTGTGTSSGTSAGNTTQPTTQNNNNSISNKLKGSALLVVAYKLLS